MLIYISCFFVSCLTYVYVMYICLYVYLFIFLFMSMYLYFMFISLYFLLLKESSIFPIPFSLGPFQYCFCFSDSPEICKGILIVLFLIWMCQTGQGCFSVSDRHILWLFILLRFQLDSLLVSYGC